MRPVLAALCLLALSPGVLAAEALPRFKKHTPYPEVRAQLIRMGYRPVPVRPKPGAIPACWNAPRVCRKYPEVVGCAGTGVRACGFLFERQTDGRKFIVGTAGEENPLVSPPDFRFVVFEAIFEARPSDLSDVVIASPSRSGSRRP